MVFTAGSGLKNLDEWPELDQSIKEAKKSVEDLNYYVDGAFKDGIVTETEAVAIEKYLNTVNVSKAEVEATYKKLYEKGGDAMYFTSGQDRAFEREGDIVRGD